VNIALDVLQMKNEGKSIKEIRDKIDADYAGMGYTPTPTPPVSD
jgi:hypothetical protein